MSGSEHTSPSPPSDAGSSDASDYANFRSEPRLTAEELGKLFLDFYEFLATLHYDPAHLKVPPAGGWPHLTPESCEEFGKSDLVIDVLRHLPYFDDESPGFVHYKSRLIDYSSFEKHDFRLIVEDDLADGEFWCSEDGIIMDEKYILRLADGHESMGREFYLDVLYGEITEDLLRSARLAAVRVEDFFENLKEQYRSLQLIPCPGRITIETDHVAERADEITEEDFRAQTEGWETALDIQYLRQIYRQHGWPENFRRDEVTELVDELMESILEQRSEWETVSPGWQSSKSW